LLAEDSSTSKSKCALFAACPFIAASHVFEFEYFVDPGGRARAE
jgi:hypothetical protein